MSILVERNDQSLRSDIGLPLKLENSMIGIESIPYKNGSNGLQIDFKILRAHSYKMRLFPVEKEGSNN